MRLIRRDRLELKGESPWSNREIEVSEVFVDSIVDKAQRYVDRRAYERRWGSLVDLILHTASRGKHREVEVLNM